MTALKRPTNEELRAREFTIVERIRQSGGTDAHAIAAVDADRAARWTPLVQEIWDRTHDRQPARVHQTLQDWAAQMTARHGPKVQVWRNTVDWITALVIVRYGEAEDFWPASLDDEDVQRARRWMIGDRVPLGVQYITVED